jgi:hypothetical protein
MSLLVSFVHGSLAVGNGMDIRVGQELGMAADAAKDPNKPVLLDTVRGLPGCCVKCEDQDTCRGQSLEETLRQLDPGGTTRRVRVEE